MKNHIPIAVMASLLVSACTLADSPKQPSKSAAVDKDMRVRFVVIPASSICPANDAPFARVIRAALKSSGFKTINGAKQAHDLVIQVSTDGSSTSLDVPLPTGAIRGGNASIGGEIVAIRDGATVASAHFEGEIKFGGDNMSKSEFKSESDKCMGSALKNSNFSQALSQVLGKAIARKSP